MCVGLSDDERFEIRVSYTDTSFKRVEPTVLRRICRDYVTRFDDLSVLGQIRAARGAYNRRGGEYGSFQRPKHVTENQHGIKTTTDPIPANGVKM